MELSPKQRKYLIAWAVFGVIGAAFFITGLVLWYHANTEADSYDSTTYTCLAALGFLFATLSSFCFLEYWHPPGPRWP